MDITDSCGVKLPYNLPKGASCQADEDRRSPAELIRCPLGRSACIPELCENYEEFI